MMTETTENERSAEALKDSEEKLRAVIYGSPIPQFMIDQNHRVIHWNHALEAISGIKAETVIGTDQHWMAFYKDPRPCMADLMVDGESDLVPVWYAGKYRKSELIPDAYEATDFFPTLGNDGKWLSFTVAAIRDSEGNVIGAVETLQDITQQKRAEEALLKSKEELEERVKERTSKLLDAYEKMESDLEERVRMENLLRKSEVKFRTVANYPYDWEYWIAPDGSFKYISPSCERITGYAPDEFIDNPGLLSAITHPEDKLNVGSLLDMPDSRGPFSVDFRIITKNGDVRWIAHVCQPVFGDDGQLLGRRSSNREITERKLQEEALIRLSTAVEQAGEGILITDTQGIIQYANPSVEYISGYDKTELLGTRSSIFKSDEHDQEFFKDLWNRINSGKVWNGRFVNKRKDGATYSLDTTISPVRDPKGAIVNFVAVQRNVTEQLELGKQLLQAQKMEAVGTLAGGIAHDFNNLLQAITGYTELLMMGKQQGTPELDDLQRIYDSSKRGADLVKSLLLFSRKVQPELRPVDLNHEIVEVQKLLSHTIAKTIKIDLRLSGKLESVLADTPQIGQVLMNLGVNARDAMPDGGTLTIETTNVRLDKDYCDSHPELKPGPYVLLAVSDTGQGMDKETLAHIFEPFFTTKEVGKGTGLGLATVYGIVKQHRGQITVYSEIGLGTIFKIFLPAIQTEKTSETQIQDAPIQRGTETILLVDDEESLRKVNSRLLNKYGYRVIMASNGKEALETYKKEGEGISLIILDLIMPVMDGKKCLEEILRINPNAKVIIASGDSEKGLANFIHGKRAEGFIYKPYDIRELLTTIREIIDKD